MNLDDRFRCEAMAHSVSPRPALTVFGSWTRTFLCVFPVGGDLFLCGHSLWPRLPDCEVVASLTLIRMRLLPKLPGKAKGVDLEFFPPGNFIAGLMQLPVMAPAERHGELVADLDP